MSEDFVLNAELRDDTGKGASRRLRRDNKVPAIIYGGGKEPEKVTLGHNDVLLQLDNEAFYSHVLTVKLGGKEQQTILRDVQRHPYKQSILHIDLLRVSKDKAIHVHVPLHYLNEEKCVGVKTGGGLLSKTVIEIEVSCLPKDLPEYIEVDVIGLELGEAIHLSEVTLPKGVEIVALSHGADADHDIAIASVYKPRAASDDDETAAADDAAAPSDEPASDS